MNWHEIDFTVPLSGSQLFDLNARVTAMNLCSRFPGLDYTCDESVGQIRIFGKLDDMWFNEWNKTMFNMGK